MWRKITYKCTEEENMFFLHIYECDEKGQRQQDRPPVRSGSVAEVPGENDDGKVEFLNKFFA